MGGSESLPDPDLKPYLSSSLTPSSAFRIPGHFHLAHGPALPARLHWLTAPVWKSPEPLAQIHSVPNSPHPAFMENSRAVTALPEVLKESVVCGRHRAKPNGRDAATAVSCVPLIQIPLNWTTKQILQTPCLIGFQRLHLQGLMRSRPHSLPANSMSAKQTVGSRQ